MAIKEMNLYILSQTSIKNRVYRYFLADTYGVPGATGNYIWKNPKSLYGLPLLSRYC
jgi:hypothetical protein